MIIDSHTLNSNFVQMFHDEVYDN